MKRIDFQFRHFLLWCSFLIYLIFAAKILIFRNSGPYYHNESVWNNINFVPFKSIWMYLTSIEHLNLSIILMNLLGNIFLFLPLGVFSSLLFKKMNSIKKVTLFTLCTSLLVEVIQLINHNGQSDVDDVILNTLGGSIGASIYFYIIKKEFLLKSQRNYTVLFLILMTASISGGLVLKKYVEDSMFIGILGATIFLLCAAFTIGRRKESR